MLRECDAKYEIGDYVLFKYIGINYLGYVINVDASKNYKEAYYEIYVKEKGEYEECVFSWCEESDIIAKVRNVFMCVND